jgi:hypothetical protein
VTLLGHGARRTSNQPYVPVLIADSDAPPAGISWARSGAQVLPAPASTGQAAQALLDRVRVAWGI